MQKYDDTHRESAQSESKPKGETSKDSAEREEINLSEGEDEEEEEFTPSAWNATLAPHRSALRSPDKTQKSGVS